MDKEWIDIIDTAVKIGLGAFISGGFTYLGMKYKHSIEKEKFMLEQKVRMLEQISSDVHEYIISWLYFSSTVSGITHSKNLSGKDGSDFTIPQRKNVNDRNNQLVESWPKREAAIAKLTLLKANNVVDALNECRDLESELRNKILFDKVVPLHHELKAYTSRARFLVKKVNSELSSFYSILET